MLTNPRLSHNILLYKRKATIGKSSVDGTKRERLSPAESGLKGRICEVHPGADSAKEKCILVAGYGLHTLRVSSGGIFRDFFIRVEPRINSVSLWMIKRRSFFISQERQCGFMGIISYIKEEIKVVRERDPAIKSNMEVLLYPSFKVILRYRIAHKLYLKKHYFFARWISQRGVRKTGIEIHPGAKIGKGLFIDHGSGVIIGETAEIGNNVTLYQGVTLGGTGKEKGKRHPTLRDNVMVSAGAKVLGSFTIGENSKIGAGSVVLNEVPPNCTVVGVPGRIVKMGDQKIPRMDMDQVHLPDPITNDIRELQADNIRMHSKIKELEKHMTCVREENNIEIIKEEEQNANESI